LSVVIFAGPEVEDILGFILEEFSRESGGGGGGGRSWSVEGLLLASSKAKFSTDLYGGGGPEKTYRY